MPPKLKLVYFNIRGRGELIRLVLVAGGVDFIDERIEYTDWPDKKAGRSLKYNNLIRCAFLFSVFFLFFLAKEKKRVGVAWVVWGWGGLGAGC